MRSIALRLLLLMTSFALVAVGLEGMLRIAAPFPSFKSEAVGAYPADRFDEQLGWAGVPDLNATFAMQEFKIEFANNSAGFRDDAIAPKLERSKREKRTRVLLLGDSFAWG
jgi:hypothetical protein